MARERTSTRREVGVDLIEIERIRRALERHGEGFKERCFTDAERAYCDSKPNPPQHYAGRFAAKEAVGKALGSGVYFTWKEIEIRGRPKPGVHLTGRTAAWAEKVGAGTDRALDDALARARRGGRGGVARMRLEPLLTADETRAAEEAHPGSLDELMERAGAAVADVVLRRFPGRVTVVCGGGNNGGDGRVCARVLREAGREVTVVDGVGDLGEPDVIVDALLGIGLRDAPREDAARMIELINASGRPVVAVDVPSGVNASTGEVPGAAVRATVTVTFGAAKVGLAVAPGRFHAGSVHVAPIGLRPREHEHALVPASALLDVPRKGAESTKYSAGSVLIVGGSRGLTGAPMLSALAAFRADAGYVAVAAPESTLPVLEARAARGRQASAAGGHGRAGCCRARPTRSSMRPRRPTRSRSGRDSAAATARSSSCGSCSSGSTSPVVLDADALWELEPFARARADGAHAARRRARAAARTRVAGDRRAPARRGPPCRVALRLGRAAEGRRHARRRAARRRARRRRTARRRSRPPAPATC